MTIQYLLPFLLSFILSIAVTPLIIKFSHRYGFIAEAKEDRWHRQPTALLGGIGIFLSFIISFLIFIPLNKLFIGILLCSTAIFSLGLYDDLREIKPYTKFIFQVIIAITVVFLGVKIEIISIPFIAIPLTILWIVGITNAFNILDNMDGLSSGISFISSICIFIYALQGNLILVAIFAAIISGGSLGFLIYNFNPAKIFMGDSGSLFLGFILSIITILGSWQEATNLLFISIVPLLIMIVPIFDTTLVTFQRKAHGKSISQGGIDHSSHRLVFMGLSEKKAVIVLLGISLLVGLTGVLLSKLNFFTTLILSSVVVVCLLLFGVFLGGIKVYAEKSNDTIQRRNLIVNSVILYKKQILQIIIDIILISIAYISSYLLRYEGAISEYNLHLIEISLPIIILSKFAMFSIFGLYRGEWKYVGINDLIKVFKSVSFGSLLFMTILLVLYRFEGYSRSVFIIDYIMTMLMIGGCRVLIRVYKEYFTTIADSGEKTPILIVGAGDGGELLLREIKNNSKINYKPIGFIDDDLEKKGMIIHNLKVLGARKDIPAIVKAKGIKEVVISIPSAEEDQIKDIYEICEKLNIKCKRIRPLIDVKRESIVSLRYNELNREKESDYFLTELEKIKAKKIREWETKELREDIGWEGESLREDEKRKDARENK